MATYGIPPELQLFAAACLQQIKLLAAVAYYRYKIALEFQRYCRLPPGEQYRRHLRAGGWGAY